MTENDGIGDTGIAQVLDRLVAAGATVRRLNRVHSGEDVNLWFVTRPDSQNEVQIETPPTGKGPYLVKGNFPGQRMVAVDEEEAVRVITEWLS